MGEPKTVVESYTLCVDIYVAENGKSVKTVAYIKMRNGATVLHWPKQRPYCVQVAMPKGDAFSVLVFANAVSLDARGSVEKTAGQFDAVKKMFASMVKQ